MAERPRKSHRFRGAIELAVVGAVILALSIYALWRMDYLSSATAHQIRMTDSTRTAYVAKNIAEGRGYTTDELPAYLLSFYEHEGKLHQQNWPNADRFPFTAYAVAALYKVTGSTSEEVGILAYNLICFVGFLVVLYWLVRTVWNDRWSALFALTLALLHPLTYVYLYLKDADMMLLVTGVMFCFWRYFERPGDQLSWKRALGMGTLLGWLFLARPNIGMPFILYFGILILRRLWVARKDGGLAAAIKNVARHEGIVVGAIALWCIPFFIHSMAEWHKPFFSANAIYQLPLGTRYAMGTDTWWKYSDPAASTMTVGTLMSGAPDQLFAKFTTSWIATIKTTIAPWAMELFLACGFLAVLKRKANNGGTAAAATISDDDLERDRRVRRLAGFIGFGVLINFLMLPLYGYQNYGYRHYLSFFLPLIWLCGGRAIAVIVDRIKPAWSGMLDSIRTHPGRWLGVLALAITIWNFGSRAQDANQLFTNTSRYIGTHWLWGAIALGLIVWHRPLLHGPGRAFTRWTIWLTLLVFARYVPNLEVKRNNLNWFPADTRVWDVLRQRQGLVMSFAMQGEVNWVSGRRNIPAPENILHAYSFLIDHKLEVEDVYVESAETMLNSWDGAFYYAAPGFESYVRMQKYHGRLPGYDLVFESATVKGYDKYKVKPRPKASTVWRLSDRDAVKAMLESPDRIDLGDVANVVYTTHGWGEYVTLEGRRAVAATDATNSRYLKISDKPYEDTSVSFFLDDRQPTSIDLDIYAINTARLDFFWNLDLYAYDRAADRPKHAIGSYTPTGPGWQHVHLDLPPGVTRKGLNKVGFKTSAFQPLVACPTGYPDAACAGITVVTDPLLPDYNVAAKVVRVDGAGSAIPMRASLFAGALEFHY